MLRNPYNNVGNVLPPQPYGSVVDKVKDNENVLIETAGLNGYNFLDLGQELKAWNHIQQIHRSAYPPNRSNEFNIDTSNLPPRLSTLYYKGVAQNYPLLNNPPDHNQNFDMTSQRTYIKPYYTTKEQFGSLLPIQANDSILPLGPIYIKKTILRPNNLE